MAIFSSLLKIPMITFTTLFFCLSVVSSIEIQRNLFIDAKEIFSINLLDNCGTNFSRTVLSDGTASVVYWSNSAQNSGLRSLYKGMSQETSASHRASPKVFGGRCSLHIECIFSFFAASARCSFPLICCWTLNNLSGICSLTRLRTNDS